MQSKSLDSQPKEPQTTTPEIGVYECEIHLKFRLIEEKGILKDRSGLLERLLDAFAYGPDEYMEPVQVEAIAQEVSELLASPEMRRQLIRLRNSNELI